MIKKLLDKFGTIIGISSLLGILGVIIWKTCIPGTILSGWDTLHPEFNYLGYFQRILYGVWQQHQGLGTLASQAHASEIPRLLILIILDLFLPQNLVRYSFFFLTLIVGVVGMYFFLNSVIKGGKLAGFLGACFYFLNLTVVQHYFVPLEMFAVHFATLPWLFLFAYSYLKVGRKKNLVLFSLVNFFAASMAHTATLFYVYYVVFILTIGVWTLIAKLRIKRMLLLVVLTFTLHAYWLLPNIYFVLNKPQEVQTSKIHSNFSDEAFFQSQSFGTFPDLVLQKNFLFNWLGYNFESQKFEPLLQPWTTHLSNQLAQTIGFSLFMTGLLGILVVLKKRDKTGLALLPALFIAVFFWINQNPPFTSGFLFLKNNINFFGEAFRFPFTKFSILIIFCLSLYFAFFINSLTAKIQKIKLISNAGTVALFLVVVTSLVYFVWPMLSGNLISPLVKTKIPDEYFQMFKWFSDKDPSLRIAKLPLSSYWGWNYNNWGYEGAGFSWFGLKQPILEREFDRWSPFNETFYNQASFALYSQDLDLFEQVLDKYQVSYLLLDKSVMNAGGDNKLLFIPETEDLLVSSDRIRKEKEFGFLTLYSFDGNVSDNFVWSPSTYSFVNSDSTYSEKDIVYEKIGNYVSWGNQVTYPFSNFDERVGVEISKGDKKVTLTKHFPNPLNVVDIGFPDLSLTSVTSGVYASYTDSELVLDFEFKSPSLVINNQEIPLMDLNNQKHLFELGKKPGYVSFLDNIFDLSKLGESRIFLGAVNIPLNSDDVLFSAFSQDSIEEDGIKEGILSEKVRICADPEKVFDLESSENSFVLSSGQDSVCLGESFNVKKDSIYEFSFKVEKGAAKAGFCITGGGEQKCLERFNNVEFLEEENFVQYKIIEFLPVGDYWIDFVLVKDENNTFQQVRYNNFLVKSYSKIGQSSYPLTKEYTDNKALNTKTLNQQITALELNLPTTPVFTKTPSNNQGNDQATNCDSLKRGDVGKKVTGNGIVYTASDNGVSCDYYLFPGLENTKDYLIRIKGENIKGRSLKYYLVNNQTGRADLEWLLPEKNFDEFYFLPAYNNNEGQLTKNLGYTLNLETRSFGRITSENILETVEFYEIPFDWISNITLNDSSLSSESEIINNLQISDLKKVGNYKYIMQTKGEGVLALSQGYEKGWIALIVPSQSTIFNTKTLEHVMVNGWANGWILPNTNDNVFDSNQVIIIFWPQYLEFIGFGFMILALLFVVRFRPK